MNIFSNNLLCVDIMTVKTGATTRTGLQHTANMHTWFTYAVWGYLFAKKHGLQMY